MRKIEYERTDEETKCRLIISSEEGKRGYADYIKKHDRVYFFGIDKEGQVVEFKPTFQELMMMVEFTIDNTFMIERKKADINRFKELIKKLEEKQNELSKYM